MNQWTCYTVSHSLENADCGVGQVVLTTASEVDFCFMIVVLASLLLHFSSSLSSSNSTYKVHHVFRIVWIETGAEVNLYFAGVGILQEDMPMKPGPCTLPKNYGRNVTHCSLFLFLESWLCTYLSQLLGAVDQKRMASKLWRERQKAVMKVRYQPKVECYNGRKC